MTDTLRAEGMTGQIEVSNGVISITRKGLRGTLSQGKKGELSIPVSQVTRVDYKEQTLLVNGHLHFLVEGEKEHGSLGCPRTVVFRGREQEEAFGRIAELVNKLKEEQEAIKRAEQERKCAREESRKGTEGQEAPQEAAVQGAARNRGKNESAPEATPEPEAAMTTSEAIRPGLVQETPDAFRAETVLSPQKPGMKCPTCSAENEEGNRFCAMCGAKLQLICPSCRVSCDPNLHFCGHCGADLTKAEDETVKERQPSRAPVELTEKWVTEFKRIGWGQEIFEEKIRKHLRTEIVLGDGEEIVFAQQSYFLRPSINPDAYADKERIHADVDGLVGTNRRLIILTTKGLSAKQDVFREVGYAELREVLEPKEVKVGDKTVKVNGLVRLSVEGDAEPLDILLLGGRVSTVLFRFLQTASTTAITSPSADKAKKAQDIMKAAREGKPLPPEFQERLKLFQAGMKICPACGGNNIERKMGGKDSAISGAMIGGTILTGGAMFLPAAAWSFMGKKDFCYTCKACEFTWKPLQPEA